MLSIVLLSLVIVDCVLNLSHSLSFSTHVVCSADLSKALQTQSCRSKTTQQNQKKASKQNTHKHKVDVLWDKVIDALSAQRRCCGWDGAVCKPHYHAQLLAKPVGDDVHIALLALADSVAGRNAASQGHKAQRLVFWLCKRMVQTGC